MEAINLALSNREIKPKTASGVVKITVPACRGFAANDAKWHRGCEDCCDYDPSGAVFNEQGDILWRVKYTLWGEILTQDSERSIESRDPRSASTKLRFMGQIWDEESGLHYNRHRYYDPITAQYISPDPIGLNGGLTPQSYVHNPTKFVDPLGLKPCPCAQQSKLKERGYEDVRSTKNGGLDYSDSSALYNKNGANPIQKIDYTGNYHKDFEAANMSALGQKSTPKGYVWHHLDDYDPKTNTGTMQLINRDAHAGIQHVGGASQYKAATGNSYVFKTW